MQALADRKSLEGVSFDSRTLRQEQTDLMRNRDNNLSHQLKKPRRPP